MLAVNGIAVDSTLSCMVLHMWSQFSRQDKACALFVSFEQYSERERSGLSKEWCPMTMGVEWQCVFRNRYQRVDYRSINRGLFWAPSSLPVSISVEVKTIDQLSFAKLTSWSHPWNIHMMQHVFIVKLFKAKIRFMQYVCFILILSLIHISEPTRPY